MLLYKVNNQDKYIMKDGVVRKFNRLGKFESIERGNNIFSSISGTQIVNAVSLLSSGGNILFIGLQQGESFREFKSNDSYSSALLKLNNSTIKNLVLLTNSSSQNGVAYNQSIFLYTLTTDVYKLIKLLGVQIVE